MFRLELSDFSIHESRLKEKDQMEDPASMLQDPLAEICLPDKLGQSKGRYSPWICRASHGRRRQTDLEYREDIGHSRVGGS
jgi:hypothetical protein